ncbi:MAG: CaiB/BaiF CoA transferase family protein [Chloroflexota bacterium]
MESTTSKRKESPSDSSVTADPADRENQVALAGLRVLDVGTLIAGPFGATLLADFGAEVIKVEQPGIGDPARHVGYQYRGRSLYWASEGRNKKSITLDLRKEEGQSLLKELVRISDVVVENFRPGTLEGWNLGYEQLSAVNPRIILARISGYGQTGPYSHLPGFDRIGVAVGGLYYVTGFPDHPPVRPGWPVCDYGTGVYNALAILIAIYYRDVVGGGVGQVIDLALYESVFRMAADQVAAYDKLGVVRERTGNFNRDAIPGETFETSDHRWIVVVAATPNTFSRLLSAMEREDLLSDPRFSTYAQRLANADELHRIIGEWVKARPLSQVIATLDEHGVPNSRVYNTADMFEDPHYQARGNIAEVEDPVMGPVKMPRPVPHFSLTPGRINWTGPALGQHNEEIYCGLLGLSPNDLARLREARVI